MRSGFTSNTVCNCKKDFLIIILKGVKNGWNKEPRVWINLRRPFTDKVELRKSRNGH